MSISSSISAVQWQHSEWWLTGRVATLIHTHNLLGLQMCHPVHHSIMCGLAIPLLESPVTSGHFPTPAQGASGGRGIVGTGGVLATSWCADITPCAPGSDITVSLEDPRDALAFGQNQRFFQILMTFRCMETDTSMHVSLCKQWGPMLPLNPPPPDQKGDEAKVSSVHPVWLWPCSNKTFYVALTL